MNNAVMDERLRRIDRLFEKAQQLMENVEKFKQSYGLVVEQVEQPKINSIESVNVEPINIKSIGIDKPYEVPVSFTQPATPNISDIQSIGNDVKQSIQETSQAYEEIDLDALLSSMDLNLDL